MASDGHDEAPPPKPAATFSSFINKNTTGNKFAPKAARRRPAPPSKPAPATESTEPPVATAAAQEPPAQTAPVAAPAPQEVTSAREEESAPQPAPQQEESIPQPSPQEEQSPQEDRPLQQVPPQEEAATHGSTGQAPAAEPVESTIDPTPTEPTGQAPDSEQLPRRRRLPWVAVNHLQGNDEASPAPAKRALKPAQSQKGGDAREAEQDDVDVEDDVPHTGKRPSAKALGKRKAATTIPDDNADAQPTPKRARRPRKAKGKATAETGQTAEDDIEPEVDGDEEVTIRRNPRQTKKKLQTTEGDAENAQPKRKGRPLRQATPSDAEDEVIDPENTFMDGLASRNIRRGKLSNREKQMREIDWVAVRQRQRDEDSRPIPSKKEIEEAERAEAEAGPANLESGATYEVVDDEIVITEPARRPQLEDDVNREFKGLVLTEIRDITSRVNSRSYMKSNKRFPNEFLLPGQGRRWNDELTELFYQGLRNFGTDFQMISTMFADFNRRAIKTKFTREERANPERVKEALQGRSEIHSNWEGYLEASGKQETDFADADRIKQELADEEARMEEVIAAAKQKTEEQKEQRRLAGVPDDEEPRDKRKQKRKGKENQEPPK